MIHTKWLSHLQISSSAFAQSKSLGWSVDRNKYEVSFLEGRYNVGGKEEILPSTLNYNVLQAWLVDWQFGRVPLIYSTLIHVNHSDLNIRALVSQDATSWSPNITCSDAADLFNRNNFI